MRISSATKEHLSDRLRALKSPVSIAVPKKCLDCSWRVKAVRDKAVCSRAVCIKD